jgi:crooked neck
MEEMLGNFSGARAIFNRWMEWEPDVNAWHSYIQFECRYGQISNARHVYERLVRCHPRVETYLKYASFEVRHGERGLARQVSQTETDGWWSSSSTGGGGVAEIGRVIAEVGL